MRKVTIFTALLLAVGLAPAFAADKMHRSNAIQMAHTQALHSLAPPATGGSVAAASTLICNQISAQVLLVDQPQH